MDMSIHNARKGTEQGVVSTSHNADERAFSFSGRSRSRRYRCGRLRVVGPPVRRVEQSCTARRKTDRGLEGLQRRGTRLAEFLKRTAARHLRRSRRMEPDEGDGSKAAVSSAAISSFEVVESLAGPMFRPRGDIGSVERSSRRVARKTRRPSGRIWQQ